MPCTENVASDAYADFITRFFNPPEEFLESSATDCVDFINRQFAVVYTPLETAQPLSISGFTYLGIPKLYSLLDTTSMESSGVLTTFRSPVLGNRGRGVIIGFIDTGIDYQNPLFRNEDGSTRILGIWDQTVPAGASEEKIFPSLYGTEYTSAQIDEALNSENPLSVVPSADVNGHGTFLASIAAGNQDEQRNFTGAAPKSAIAVVKLKPAKQYLRDFYLIQEDVPAYQENDIMMGVGYLLTLARRYSRPIVICLGVGTNQGSHDGTAPLGLFLETISSYVGVSVVIAAGNETGYGHHYRGLVEPDEELDDVELRVGEGERGFIIELWAQQAELYNVGFVSPSGEVIRRLPISSTDATSVSFLLEQTRISVNYRIADVNTGSQLIYMKFENPTPGIWHIIVHNALYFKGLYHMWLPCYGFITEDTYFLRPDPDTTITEPGNAQFPITVAACNHETGSLYIHSSRGFSRTGVPKPDLAAPGVDVMGAGLLPAADAGGASSREVPTVRRTGTSVAAAHVAGAAANLLSWGLLEGNEPYMTNSVIKTYLIRGAKRNPVLRYPNREFGYGTLDLYGAFLSVRE